MVNILQVTNAYPTEKFPLHGIFVKEQLNSLRKLNCEFDLYVINGKEEGKKAYYKAYKELRSILPKYNVIHCHHLLAALVVLLIKPAHTKVLVSFLSDGGKELILPNFGFNKLVGERLFRYVSLNSDIRIFKKGIPGKFKDDPNSYYLPNGVNMDFFYPKGKFSSKEKLGLDQSKKYILFASLNNRDRREKRYDIFKETLCILKDEYGYDDVEELLLIKVERDLVPLYFNAAELHLLTSDFEGSPNSVKESLSCNTSVVSTDVGNVRELVNGLEGCFVSDSNNPRDLAALVDKSFKKNIAENKYRESIVKLKLDMESVAIELLKIYKSLE
ncbi:glycosyltransferase family 4 protein [Fulvivirga maritima]|uniref:glycosyltransferase family 4 protein n=1 Tax=Fulvivirga maritima TaxID=2904247 RepID=UPI001F15AE34|nr:glycosyltransferase family 4 protein [Fulvivirga maritima]UII27946.1 glycosyltransferase family 4 protein [Fulvivirga maritima]